MKTGGSSIHKSSTNNNPGYLGYSNKPSSANKLNNSNSSNHIMYSNSFNSFDKENLGAKGKKNKSRKPTVSSKFDSPIFKKRNFDFTDYAYREAVNRLKFLLAESYTPSKFASKYNKNYDDIAEDAEHTSAAAAANYVERPPISEVSKYFPTANLSRYNAIKNYNYNNNNYLLKPSVSTTSLHAPSICPSQQAVDPSQPPPELLNFIEKQEGYIEQLERESMFCRDELSTLLTKVKDVISENETLTDQAKSGIVRGGTFNDSSESDENDYDRLKLSSSKKHLSGPNIVFESRISELEAQLAQSNIDLKKISEENEANKRKMADGFVSPGDYTSEAYKKQLEILQRDKSNLEDTVKRLQASVAQLKESDATNFSKTQRNRDIVEHAIFERTQCDLEIRRLKEELERQHERVREVQHEMARKISEERSNAERRYTYQVDQLGGDLSSQWEQATKLQLELERQKRIDADHKRELAQKNSQIDELKSELKNKNSNYLSDLAQVNSEKQSLEQEITSLRIQLERGDRHTKVENSRQNAEITSLRQRLDRSDADLLHARRENLRLCDQISSLEKEIALGDITKEHRPRDMTKIISDMESKHAPSQPINTIPNSTTSQPAAEEKNGRYGSGTVSRSESRAGIERPYSKQQEYGATEISNAYDGQHQLGQQQQQPQYQDIGNVRSESRLSKYNTSSDKYPEEKRSESRSDSSLGKYNTDGEKYATDEKRSESRLSKLSADGELQQSKYGGIEKSKPTTVASPVEKPIAQQPEYENVPKYENPVTQPYIEPVQYEENPAAAPSSTRDEQYSAGAIAGEVGYQEPYQAVGQNENIYDPNIAGYDNTQYTEQQYPAAEYDPNIEYTQQGYDPQQYGTNYQEQQYANQQEYAAVPAAYDASYQPGAVDQQPIGASGYMEQEQGNGTLGYANTGGEGAQQYKQ